MSSVLTSFHPLFQVTLALDPHAYWVIERLAESFITSLAAPVGAKRNIPIAVALKGLQIMCEDMGPQAARLSKHQVRLWKPFHGAIIEFYH